MQSGKLHVGGGGKGVRTKRRRAERPVRSRSYPGFSIGILLTGKVILPLNSVFIPLLNEIHRSMERERCSALSLQPVFFALFGHTIPNEYTTWDK